MDCAQCHAPMPTQTGPGRRRTKCEACSPRRDGTSVSAFPKPPKPSSSVSVAAVVLAQLADAGRVECVQGAVALSLAAQIDAGGQSGASMAALSREVRAAVEAALKDSVATGDAVDELRERRAQRRSG